MQVSLRFIGLAKKQLTNFLFHQSTYIIESTFWLTWVPARGFSAVFDLAQLINLVTMTVKTKITGRKRTPREAREWTKPNSFAFEVCNSRSIRCALLRSIRCTSQIYGANLLFLCCVGLTYACLAPIIAFATMIVLWSRYFQLLGGYDFALIMELSCLVWYFVYKYQLMFVFVTEVESGGRLFPVMINRLLVSLAFSNLLLALSEYQYLRRTQTSLLNVGGLLAIALARHWLYLLVQVPPLLLILLFKIYLSLRYGESICFHSSNHLTDLPSRRS